MNIKYNDNLTFRTIIDEHVDNIMDYITIQVVDKNTVPENADNEFDDHRVATLRIKRLLPYDFDAVEAADSESQSMYDAVYTVMNIDEKERTKLLNNEDFPIFNLYYFDTINLSPEFKIEQLPALLSKSMAILTKDYLEPNGWVAINYLNGTIYQDKKEVDSDIVLRSMKQVGYKFVSKSDTHISDNDLAIIGGATLNIQYAPYNEETPILDKITGNRKKNDSKGNKDQFKV